MMNIFRTKTILGLTCALLLAAQPVSSTLAAGVEANVMALNPGDTIPLTIIPKGVYLRASNDPAGAIWDRVPEYQVQLLPAPPVHASVQLRQDGDNTPMPLYFSVVSDRERLYIKLRWVDGSENTLTRADKFRDGTAVQFALNGGAATSFMMGSSDMPVNIWYWKSDEDSVQNLAAGGFGSTTLLPQQPVSASSLYTPARLPEDSQWTVVMSRPLNAEGEYMATFEAGTVQPLSFAVWQGADKQRDGHKRVTMGWVNVDLKPLLDS